MVETGLATILSYGKPRVSVCTRYQDEHLSESFHLFV